VRSIPSRPACLTLLLGLSFAGPVRAVDLNWANAGGGAASKASNWTPAQSPTATDTLVFDLASTYNVNFNAQVPEIAKTRVRSGDVTFQCNAPVLNTGLFYVAGSGGTTATWRLPTGSFTTNDNAYLGLGAGANGTAIVSEMGSALTQTLLCCGLGPDFVLGSQGGTGSLQVINGAHADLGNTRLGNTAGSTGTLEVSGYSFGPGVFARSSATVGELLLGVGGGTGTCEVLDGALAQSGFTYVGSTVGSNGTLLVSGGSPYDSARVSASFLYVGYSNVYTHPPAGTGAVFVGANSVLDVSRWTNLGSDAGGAGQLTVYPGARFRTGTLDIQAGGSLLQTGGLVQVGEDSPYSSGFLHAAGDVLTVNAAFDRPTLELITNTSCALHGPASQRPLIVGSTGMGTFRVLDNATLTVDGDSPVIGQSAGSNGELDVEGNATFTSGQPLFAGSGGYGMLRVRNGGHATLAGAMAGVLSTGAGGIEVGGSGSEVDLTDQLVVGGTPSGPSGALVGVSVHGGGVLRLMKTSVSGIVYAGDTLTAGAGGTIELTTASSTLDHRGELAMTGGTLTGGSMICSNGSRIAGHGDVNVSLATLQPSTASIVADGPLSLGRDDAPLTGILWHGTLDAGAGAVTLRDPGKAIVDVVTLAGGSLAGPAGGTTIQSLSGRGTVHGAVENAGSVLSVLPGGLTFDGVLTSETQSVGGEGFRFLAGGGFTGSGLLDGSFRFDSLSSLTATGSLQIGSTTLATPLQLDGAVHAGSHTITFLSPGDVALGDSVVLLNGALSNDGSGFALVLRPDAVLAGTGTVLPRMVANGTLAPGSPAGRLVFPASLTLGGTYACDLGDHATGECDLIDVSGTATLGGTLALHLLPDYQAAAQDSFLVVRYGSHSGGFTGVTLNGQPTLGLVAVRAHSDGVWVVVQSAVTGVDPEAPPAGTLAFSATGSPGPSPAFELALPDAAHVELRWFDVSGREIGSPRIGDLAAGHYRFAADAGPGASGVLFARIEVRGPGGRWVRTARAVRIR
jgi:T5SS/PEP-CTERM-associated repeat protein